MYIWDNVYFACEFHMFVKNNTKAFIDARFAKFSVLWLEEFR